jgi:hypothetical protein
MKKSRFTATKTPRTCGINPKYASPDLKLAFGLNNNEAAAYLGFAPYTLRRSRTTGKLAGVPPPKYRKIGRRKVVYMISWLDEWLEQFQPQINTAQNNEERYSDGH